MIIMILSPIIIFIEKNERLMEENTLLIWYVNEDIKVYREVK